MAVFERSDANAKELDERARSLGVEVFVMPREVGYDRLYAWQGHLQPVEYKDGLKPPSKRRLTENELKVAARLARVGVDVVVIMFPGEVNSLVNTMTMHA